MEQNNTYTSIVEDDTINNAYFNMHTSHHLLERAQKGGYNKQKDKVKSLDLQFSKDFMNSYFGK